MISPRSFDWSEARRLRRLGISYPEIGRRLGVHQSSVQYACNASLRERKALHERQRTRRRSTVNAKVFWRHVEKTESCWLWTGTLSPSGYGMASSRHRAHRVAYAWLVGELLPDHVIHHRCGNKRCVNPAHLDQIAHGDHARLHFSDALGSHARRLGELNHCKRGHPFDDANTYVTARGGRSCRACARDRRRAASLEAEAAAPTTPEKAAAGEEA